MKKTCLVAIVLLVSAVVLVACKSKQDSTETGSAKIIEPAMLFSKDDAKALTGIDFGECRVTEQPVVGQKLCVYDKGNSMLQVGLSQAAFMNKKTLASGTTPESIYQATQQAFSGAERIDGVGDDNFMAPPGLHILKDGYYITVSLGRANDREKLQAAGLTVVENLEKNR
ncbi:MAG: hypothetical protein PHO83_01890 [Geobacteraceae bacterium]|nr:hypothetical protein [Geobacteraceae bacterium]